MKNTEHKGINQLAKEIHKNNVDKGFYDSEKNIGEMLCLIHSEVSEALECDRNGKYCASTTSGMPIGDNGSRHWKDFFEASVKDTFEDELADIMIRVMDLAAFKGINLEEHIKAKMAYNATRPHKHGKKY